ncbi:MAG: 3-keto-5-aminohexanoate cleavage protein [Actinobacteria bacterium]|nr:3-keto-5-aminohexanoate cleavage protein [Actinomycetota bacterium]
MDPLVITVAGIGAELSREDQPALPLSAEEIGGDAADCAAAGASIYHLHVRDRDGAPTMDPDAFARAFQAIRSNTDLIVQFTSGGSVHDDEAARVAPLDLRPDMATLTTGSVNFGDEVFLNPLPLVERLYRKMRDLAILPEYEIFEPGMIATATRLYEASGESHHRHFDFVLGVPGGLPAWPDAIEFLIAHLPTGATWSATGVGKSHLAIATEAIERGGGVRTGLEDVRYFGAGRPARSNSELIARVAEMAQAAGREIATPLDARTLLGLSPPKR